MKKKMSQSLRMMVSLTFILLILLVSVILVVFSAQLRSQVRTQTRENTQSVLRAVGINLTRQMQQLETHMSDISTNYTVFRNLGSANDMTRVYAATEEIGEVFVPIIDANDGVTCILVYSDATNVYHGAYGVLPGDTGAARVQVKTSIRDAIPQLLVEGQISSNEWTVTAIGERYFLCYAVNWRQVYCVCMLDLENLAKRLQQEYQMDGDLFFTKGDQLLTTQILNQQESSNDSTFVVMEPVGTLQLSCVAPYEGALRLSMLQGLLLFLSALALFSLPLVYRYMHRSFLRPMNELVHSMEQIRMGDLQARPSDKYSSREFQQVNDTFNSMIGQIGDLKIERYETQLEAERNEMMALKMQIQPHFFLNCLKSLYALSASGKSAEVQSLILLLSKHLRYVLAYKEDVVPLQKELELCQNYVELHSVGRAVQTICNLQTEETLNDFYVPPVSMLTLVENSVKHAQSEGEALHITLRTQCLEMDTGKLVNITIRDNGQGFSQAQMQTLNQELPQTQKDSNHIGIDNVLRRFKLLYGDAFAVTFSNGIEGGAQIDLYISLGKEVRDEIIDCG